MLSSSCPKCNSENTYEMNGLWICPECGHEWTLSSLESQDTIALDQSVKDANGKVLSDGDSVVVIKDLKVKGADSTIKSGTKVKSIRLPSDPMDGHNISGKIDGIGLLNLKSEFVKKST